VNSASIEAGSGGAARTTEIVTGAEAFAGVPNDENPRAEATDRAIATPLVLLLTFGASSIFGLAFLFDVGSIIFINSR
jgi:hypothetical protein